MKKIFGISLGALFAAVPMMAGAANIDLSANGHGNIEAGDQNKAVSVSYVKGAYNELGTAINTKQDQLKNGETNISSAVSSAVRETGADNATLVTELAVRNAIVSAITDAGDAATSKINELDANLSTQSSTNDGIDMSLVEQNGVITSISANIKDSAVTTAKIDASAVTTAKIADSNVTTSKIADDAVTSEKIADDAVTSAAIADNAVTSDKIENGTIVVADINTSAMAAGSGTYAASSALAQQGYVDQKVAGLNIGDYATQSGVEKTINNVSYTANLNNTAVTGSVTAMSEWGSSATSAITMTGSVTNSAVTVTRSGNASYTAQ